MARSQPAQPSYQRNALLPGLIGAAALFLAPALIDGSGFLYIRYVVAIFAAIVGWFAIQAKHWWWAPIMAAIIVIWNPIVPFEFSGPAWTGAQFVGAVAFLAAAATVRTEREQ